MSVSRRSKAGETILNNPRKNVEISNTYLHINTPMCQNYVDVIFADFPILNLTKITFEKITFENNHNYNKSVTILFYILSVLLKSDHFEL